MERSNMIGTVIDLNDSVDPSRVFIQPTFHGMHNTVQMPVPGLPYYPATTEVNEDASMRMMRKNLELFWQKQRNEIKNFTGFTNRNPLPLARVKKIMKSDPDVKMIGSDTAPVFAKACEIFILEMTLRAWMETESGKRRIIQQCDIADAIKRSEMYDFLIDIVPFGPNCGRRQGVDQNAVMEQAAPTSHVQPFYSLPDMNAPAMDLNQAEVEKIPEVSPEVMADSFVSHDQIDLNSALP